MKSGETEDIRALIHMRKREAELFKAFVERKGRTCGFMTRIDAEALNH
jgi:hypothetical protein